MSELQSFKQYDKIPLQSNDWGKGYKKIKSWAVTEKVHGANFSFVFNVANETFQYAKRGGVLNDDDRFFGYRSTLAETLPKVRNVVDRTLNSFPSCELVIVFGELFGGAYPGLESSYVGVQEGVYYSPNLHFYAFDVLVKQAGELDKYLDFQQSIQFFQDAGLLYAEPLALYSTYEKAAQHKVGFCSTIPNKLGLSVIAGNKAEGIVIRSMTQRYIVKVKIPEFCESKYSENNFERVQKSTDSNLNVWITSCTPHMTKNRLNNAISKVGDYSFNNEDEILNMMVDDILLEVNGFHVFGLRELLLEITHEKFGLKTPYT